MRSVQSDAEFQSNDWTHFVGKVLFDVIDQMTSQQIERLRQRFLGHTPDPSGHSNSRASKPTSAIRLLTARAVANMLNINEQTAYRMMAKRILPTISVGVRKGGIRVPEKALEQWIVENTVPGRSRKNKVATSPK